ncbi:MAG: T9SS type A sorting domain-containing protein [Fibrobacteres bacterium]|nr:T9SS type A sorting domain-containing protein [Fibrobacterota bacterium]
MKKTIYVTLFSAILISGTMAQYLIPSNTWVKSTLTFRLPSNVTGAYWSTTDGYCTSIFDDSTGRLLWRTGVGQSGATGCKLDPGYYSNTFLSWNAIKDTAYAIDLFNWGGGSGGSGCLLPGFATDTTPSPRHTYDGITYCKSNHSVYLMAGANWKLTLDTTRSPIDARNMLLLDDSSTWRLSLNDGKWHRIHGSIRQYWNGYAASPYESHLRAWPEGGKLLYVNDGGDKHAEMNLSTEKWTNITTAALKAPMSLYNARSCWDRKRQLWVFRNDTNVCTYNPSTRTYKKLPSCKVSGSQAISYDSRRDVYVAAGLAMNSVRYFRYSDTSWVAPVIANSAALPSGYLAYDSTNDLHLLVYQQATHRFRLDTTGASSYIEKDLTRERSSDPFSIQILPNPFKPVTSLMISGSPEVLSEITIMDINGRAVMKRAVYGSNVKLDFTILPSGRYCVMVKRGNRISSASAVLFK